MFFIICVKCFFKEILNVFILDVVFVISVIVMDVEINFKLMKDIIIVFVDMYGMLKINYVVVVYGEKLKKWFDF